MPYEIKWNPDGCVLRGHGHFTDQDLEAANRQIFADPRFAHVRYQVCDFLPVTEMDLTGDAIREAAKLDTCYSHKYPGRKVAILIVGKAAFGLARMYELNAPLSKWETRIFSAEPEMWAWLA